MRKHAATTAGPLMTDDRSLPGVPDVAAITDFHLGNTGATISEIF